MRFCVLILAFGLMVLGPFKAFAQTEITHWNIDSAQSSIVFEATEKGIPFQGRFAQFSGRIIFDEQNLAQSIADIEIDIASATTGLAGRDSDMMKPEWFDQATFPKARFKTASFVKTADQKFVAKGELTIRDKTIPLTLPFTLSITKDQSGKDIAHMTSAVMINRMDFGVGQGSWSDDQTIGHHVKIMLTVVATAQ